MAVLLLRLAAPMQSWGTDDSKYEMRKTGREPTKSGVIGMIAAALGYRRDESEKLRELNRLRFGVRVDREGKLLRDFHMARGEKDSYLTNRYYLADAIFLVGLEGDAMLLSKLSEALSNPVFPLYLGRRSCPPTLPLCLGIRECDLINALRDEPPLDHSKRRAEAARIRTDADAEENSVALRDFAISFDQQYRRYGYRNAAERASVTFERTVHDPFQELEDVDVSLKNKT